MKQELIGRLPKNAIDNIYAYIAPDFRLCTWMKKYNMKSLLAAIIDNYMFGAIKIVEAFDRYFPDDSWDLYKHIINNKKWEDIKEGAHCLYEDTNMNEEKFIADVMAKMDVVLYRPDGIHQSYLLAATYIFLYLERFNLKEACQEDFIEIQEDINKLDLGM